MSIFIEQRLDPDISLGGFEGGPRFQTDVNRIVSGFENRNARRDEPFFTYSIEYSAIRRPDFVAQMRNLFMVAKGQLAGFRFRDWVDFEFNNQLIDEGDGIKTAFQSIVTFQDDLALFTTTKTIKKPNNASTAISGDPALVITVNGVPIASPDAAIDTTTGIITIAPAPPATHEIRIVSGTFDIPVRFARDYAPFFYNGFQNGTAPMMLQEDLNA